VKFVVISLLVLLSSPVFAGKVLLVWDANPPEDNVLSYAVYEYINGGYRSLGQVKTNRTVLLDVSAGSHCYAVTALNEYFESPYSEQACLTVSAASLGGSSHLDLTAPVSSVEPLPETSGVTFPLQWWGREDQDASGVVGYDIFVSTDGGPFGRWLAATALTSTNFSGNSGHHYGFYAVAIDRAGNRGSDPDFPQAETTAWGNAPPRMRHVEPLFVNAGDLLVLTNLAIDADLPVQKLRFTMDAGQIVDARINPTNGTFVWMPCCISGVTNYFTIRVSDNGSPALSATQTVAIVVNDFLEVEVGSSVVSAGNKISVPVTVYSSVPSWSLLFTLDTPAGTVQEVLFRPDTTQVCDSKVLSQNARQRLVVMQSCGNAWKGRREVVGELQLQINAAGSMFLPLLLKDTIALRQDRSEIPKVLVRPGRITLIKTEPMLEAKVVPGQGVNLQLYGAPGSTCALEVNNTSAGPNGWLPNWEGTLATNRMEFFIPAKWANHLFFRAYQVKPPR
jgi:hypothetical protein